MKSDARARIDAHHLMRTPVTRDSARVDDARAIQDVRALETRAELVRKAFLYVLIFVGSFIFTTGFMVLSVLLWVAPGNLLGLVLFGLLSGVVFVSTFASARMVVFFYACSDRSTHDDELGRGHHIAKSVAYGFVALVAAVLLAGFLINAADAFMVR